MTLGVDTRKHCLTGSKLLLLVVTLLLSFNAAAAPHFVTNSNDSGSGSLRAAIANAAPGDTINFNIPTSDIGYNSTTGVFSILLTTGELVVDKNLTINGTGAAVLKVQRSTAAETPAFRIFRIVGGASVTISGLTISNGIASALPLDSASSGGGIINFGNLAIDRCSISGNRSGWEGGAIYNGGTLTLSNSTLSGNIALGGGGLYVANSATVTNCTIVENTVAGDGGGGGLLNRGATTVNSSTIAYNSAGGAGGGGIYVGDGTLMLGNSIVAANTAPNRADCAGNVISQGNNLIQDASGTIITGNTTGNILNVAASLGPLANNGGPTFTIMPQAGSPAIDAGSNTSALTTDQRGVARPQPVGGTVDIGAVEVQVTDTQPHTALQVTTTADHNDNACTFDDCTLREAIIAANADVSASTITFQNGVSGTIGLQISLPTFNSAITLTGPGASILTVAPQNGSSLGLLTVSANSTASISGLTFSNGTGNLAGRGGAIYNSGNLTINSCAFSNNRTTGSSNGGALYNNAGTLTINSSTFSNNTAHRGGAIHSQGGTLSVTTSTFSSNTSTENGGAINNEGGGNVTLVNCGVSNNSGSSGGGVNTYGGSLSLTGCTISGNTGGGIANGTNGALSLTNCTISGNSQSFGGGVSSISGSVQILNSTIISNSATYYGGGLYNRFDSVLTVKNSIVAGNNSDFYNEGTFNDGGGNFIGGDPKLGPLQNNGGPTLTRMPLSNSPVIDAGINSGAPSTDQRGVARPADGDNNGTATVDIGAVEVPAGYTLHTVQGRVVDNTGAPLAGVMVTRTGAASPSSPDSAQTDSNGNYTFVNLPAGTYTLTPNRVGYGFSPSSRSVTVSTANITGANFTAYNYSLSGRIAFSNGVGIGNVQVRLNIGRNVLTNSAGYFTFAGVAPGAYTVTPVLAGYSFDPNLKQVTINNTSVVNVNFIGGYTITGRLYTNAGIGLPNLRVYRSGSTVAAITNSAGYFAFYGVTNGTYTLTPDATQGYGYTPQNRTLTVDGTSIGGQNFIGTSGYSISGRIANSSGTAIAGVTVTRTGSALTATTNSAGYYIFNGVPNGTYTLTPSKTGYNFTPATRGLTVNSANISGQNFIGAGS